MKNLESCFNALYFYWCEVNFVSTALAKQRRKTWKDKIMEKALTVEVDIIKWQSFQSIVLISL